MDKQRSSNKKTHSDYLDLPLIKKIAVIVHSILHSYYYAYYAEVQRNYHFGFHLNFHVFYVILLAQLHHH